MDFFWVVLPIPEAPPRSDFVLPHVQRALRAFTAASGGIFAFGLDEVAGEEKVHKTIRDFSA